MSLFCIIFAKIGNLWIRCWFLTILPKIGITLWVWSNISWFGQVVGATRGGFLPSWPYPLTKCNSFLQKKDSFLHIGRIFLDFFGFQGVWDQSCSLQPSTFFSLSESIFWWKIFRWEGSEARPWDPPGENIVYLLRKCFSGEIQWVIFFHTKGEGSEDYLNSPLKNPT